METLSGKDIRRIRETKLRMTRPEFSSEIGYSVRAVIDIETDKRTPRKYFFEQLERLLQRVIAKPLTEQLKKMNNRVKKRLELIAARGNRSQREIARKLGVSDSLISLWELGKVIPTKKRMRQLESFYGIAKERLFPDVFGQKNTALGEAA